MTTKSTIKNKTVTAPIYLKKFTLKTDYRNITPFELEFKNPLTVIVGENGSGKSSILHLMSKGKSEFHSVIADKAETRFFDTEKQNPRTQPFPENSLFGFSLQSRFSSHGETIFPILSAIKDFKNLVLFIDEPEAGLSLSKQIAFIKIMNKAIKNGCQIILSSHSYVFIKHVSEIFSLDSKSYESSTEYLKKIFK